VFHALEAPEFLARHESALIPRPITEASMPENQDNSAQSEPAELEQEATEEPKETPLEALRRAQAERSLPPGVGGKGGRGGKGFGANPSMPRRYNRGK
jgi:hypothetical protein